MKKTVKQPRKPKRIPHSDPWPLQSFNPRPGFWYYVEAGGVYLCVQDTAQSGEMLVRSRRLSWHRLKKIAAIYLDVTGKDL